MLIAYFLYIYITRLLLAVFNCTPTDPPDGKLYLQVCDSLLKYRDNVRDLYTACRLSLYLYSYVLCIAMQVVFEECGVPGGTQLTLMPWAVLGFIFYTLGYPAFLAQASNTEIIVVK